MKIYAVISYPFLPATTGGEISTQNILEYMGRVNALEVFTVEPYANIDPKQYSFRIDFGMKFTPTRYLNPLLFFKVFKKIKAMPADAIFFDQPWMGWMIPLIKLFTGKPVFLRSNNIEYLRFKSMGKSWWSLLYIYEKLVYKSASLVIFVSDVDQAKAIYEFDLPEHKTLLTPYGIPQSSLPSKVINSRQTLLHRHGIGSNQPIFLFFATLSYGPNHEAVSLIRQEIYPRLLKQLGEDFSILICGKNLPAHVEESLKDAPQIQYLGFVEDIETYIDGATLMMNPIISGGGVKTKAIDTLGRGQRVISTVTGAEGINPNVCGDCLLIADQNKLWDNFTQLMVNALSQPSPTLPSSFFDTYSWPGIIQQLMKKLQALKPL